ncbi:1097_t:CDS:2 [Funneliformis mosseae]|uniref:1097_t:CDS:1 n=1 Tax=Funneliformis mosseae TaxID=27381 RepID=A0A9N8W445_FUNMO|nr:1097_t:CDS:2 [Funneliformis mosseae]
MKTQVRLTVNNCSYCNRPFSEKFWCKECDPRNIIEGWTSGNYDIDKFIKDTIYDARHNEEARFLGWVPFDRFTNIKEIGEGGFAKVYAAIWLDGISHFQKQDDGSWKKLVPKPMMVALKRLIGSRDMSAKFLDELQAHWDLCNVGNLSLNFYGITKDPETKECMNENPNQRPTTEELCGILNFWNLSVHYNVYTGTEKYAYYGKEIREGFEEADKEIPNISILSKANPDAVYTSRAFAYKNLTNPINSVLITSYLEKDSKLFDLDIPSNYDITHYD